MSFIFVSYSRQDQDYVSLLAQALETHSLPVWLDDHIDYGTTWPRVIKEHLERCRVFVVVMSPRSENSLWVQNELTLAQKLKKPIFPLLLEGDHWFQILTIQSVDVTHGKLPPARFFNTLRPYFPVPLSTAESLPLQDVAADSISTDAPPTTPSVASPPSVEDELRSEKGIDYSTLRDLLKAEKWREADKETYNTMIRAVGKQPGDYFTSDELRNFPCADLLTIDRLWVKYSEGKFGFSVQKRIWQECGSPSSGKAWDEFCVRVGWQDAKATRYLLYKELKANPQYSPGGEFPFGVCGKGGRVGGVLWGGLWFSSLEAKLFYCGWVSHRDL
jgi:hypothetical protein